METNKTQTEQLTQDAVMQSVLKASDLRIGNFVYCKIYDKQIKMESFFGLCNIESRPDLFEPISLTEEWLAKLGYDLISENHYGVLGHLIWKIEGRFYCDKNGMQLKYVHQLQNLYFALTQSELTVV